MREAVELITYRIHHAGVTMAGIHDADAAAEIDQPVAVDVGDDRALRVRHRDRGDRGNAARHRGARRASSSRLFGPGISVRIRMTPAMLASAENGSEGKE